MDQSKSTDHASIISKVSLEWCMLALSKRITLFGPGNGFMRSRRLLMKCRKVMALNEPWTILAWMTPSRLIAGRIEYLCKCFSMTSTHCAILYLVPRSYATSIVAHLPLYDHPNVRFMLRASTAASSTDTSWAVSYCWILSTNSARRWWSRSRAIRDNFVWMWNLVLMWLR